MTANDPAAIQRVHRALFPTHGPTRLHPLPELAAQLGCAAVYVKDESVRFGLPAFKILGASWAIAATLGERWGVQPWDVEGLRAGAKQEPVTIYTATDGESVSFAADREATTAGRSRTPPRCWASRRASGCHTLSSRGPLPLLPRRARR